MFDAVVFDMDGVLVDAREWHFEALNLALSPFGAEISREEHLGTFNGLSTRRKLELLTSQGRIPKALHEIIFNIKQDRTMRLIAEKCFPIVSQQILLARLKNRGIKIGVYTNSIRETAESMLRYANVIDFFECVVTNQDVSKPKPHPEGYLLVCEKLGASPNRVLVVEDGKYGIEAARKAGCTVLEVESPEDVHLEKLSKHIPSLLKSN